MLRLLGAALLLLLSILFLQASCDCELRAPEYPIFMTDWRAMPMGTGAWAVDQGGRTAKQYPTGSPSFFVSDSFLNGPVRGTVRAEAPHNGDGYFGFSVGLSCGPSRVGPVDSCADLDAMHVIWGRGSQTANPGLCLVRENFPGFSPCPIAAPTSSLECTDPNAFLVSTLPMYADATLFHSYVEGCCDRFCDQFNLGWGWEDEREYDVILYQTPEHVRVLVDLVEVLEYKPAESGEELMTAMSRLGFVSDSSGLVTFTEFRYMETIVNSCEEQFDYVISFVPCGDRGGETLHVDWGDGSPTEVIQPTDHTFLLSHFFGDSSEGIIHSQLSLVDSRHTLRVYYDLMIFVVDAPVIEVEVVPTGACDTMTTCSDTGIVRVTRVYGGVPPYTIDWGNDYPSTINHQCGEIYECDAEAVELPHGSHVVTLTDSHGCTASAKVDLESSAVSLDIVPGICGVLEARATSDASCEDLLYQWVPDLLGKVDEEAETQEGLSPGSYTVTVTDANGCSATTSYDYAFGIDSHVAGDLLFLYMPFRISWSGYTSEDEGEVRVVCPTSNTLLFSGNLSSTTSVDDAYLHGIPPDTCQITVTSAGGCYAAIDPVYVCASANVGPMQCSGIL